jgi:hypothetical protein
MNGTICGNPIPLPPCSAQQKTAVVFPTAVKLSNSRLSIPQLRVIRISFLPKSEHRPLTPYDIQLSPSMDHLAANLIIDGKLMLENLKASGKDLHWLKSKLKAHGVTHIEDVFLATYDLKQTLTVYPYSRSDAPPDLFS